MRRSKKRIIRRVPNRSAFTLVEMLVSVALVLMLMTMFASIFQIATNSMGKQRGISELDQKARALSTVVRKDLQHRTFRYPLAFYPGENSATSPTSFSNRAGYIYISTNDPNTGLDDLIQFTVSANILSEDSVAAPYFGRAAALWDLSPNAVANPPYTGSSDPRRGSLYTHTNQPETDDGTFSTNSTGSSPFAEISYFIRRGSLYRRVSLIREPLNVAGKELGPQPTTAFGVNYFGGIAFPLSETVSSNDFPLHFDYSAVKPLGVGVFGANFLGSASLSNETEFASGNTLGNPRLRFGFNRDTGRSREHTIVPPNFPPNPGDPPAIFLGRFTQAETSTLNFNFPQAACGTEADETIVLGNGNPLDVVNTPLALNAGNGVVSDFDSSIGVEGRGGERRVEDLLLANVHEMKVELWDQRLRRFVTPGHLSSTNSALPQDGDYHLSRCHNPNAGPIAGFNVGAVFDSWHRTDAQFDSDGSGGLLSQGEQSPPYIAYHFYPPKLTPLLVTDPPGPSPNTMPEPTLEEPSNKGYWVENQGFAIGDVAFARTADLSFPGWDANNNGSFEWIADGAGIPSQAFQIAYRVVAGNDLDASSSFESGAVPPIFPTAPGRRVTDNEITWESFDNRRPLQSIRLTFRFQDKTSDNMRQLSLVIPMTETTK